MHLCKPCFHLRLTSRACLPLSIAVLKSPTNLGRASPGSTGAHTSDFAAIPGALWPKPGCHYRVLPGIPSSMFRIFWRPGSRTTHPNARPRSGRPDGSRDAAFFFGEEERKERQSFFLFGVLSHLFVLSFINSLMQRFICGKRGGSLVSASRISAAKLAAAVARLAARRPRAALRRLQPRPSCLALARVSGAARSVLVLEGKSVHAVAAPPGPSFPLCNSYLPLLRCRRRQDPRLCGCMNFAAGGLQPRSGRRWKARGPARLLVQVWGRCTAPLPR